MAYEPPPFMPYERFLSGVGGGLQSVDARTPPDINLIFLHVFLYFFVRSRFWGRGCDEALFSDKKGFFSEKGGGI